MKKFIKYCSIIYYMFRCCLMSALEYRVNYLIRASIEISYLLVNLAFYNVLYSKVDTIAGWNYHQMILLVLSNALLDSCMTFFFNDGLSEIPALINNGNMDLIFLKPINSRVYLSFRKFETSQLINMLLMVSIFIYYIHSMGLTYTFGQIIISVLLVSNGVFILYNIFFLNMILSFWTVKFDNGVSLFYQLYNFGNKPMEMFPKPIRKIFIYLIPMITAFNFSVKYISHSLSTNFVIVAFACSGVLFLITQYVYKCALKKYTGAGA